MEGQGQKRETDRKLVGINMHKLRTTFVFRERTLKLLFSDSREVLFSNFFSDISERNNDYSDTLDLRRG